MKMARNGMRASFISECAQVRNEHTDEHTPDGGVSMVRSCRDLHERVTETAKNYLLIDQGVLARLIREAASWTG